MLNLAFGLNFSDLYRRDGLLRLDAAFVRALGTDDAALGQSLLDARADPAALAPKEESGLLIALAPHVEDFISELFGIEAEVRQLSARHHELAPLYGCKRLFVQRNGAPATVMPFPEPHGGSTSLPEWNIIIAQRNNAASPRAAD